MISYWAVTKLIVANTLAKQRSGKSLLSQGVQWDQIQVPIISLTKVIIVEREQASISNNASKNKTQYGSKFIKDS